MKTIFVDTSGFYALLIKRDNMHAKAKGILHKAKQLQTRFVTTDYILDETATLLHARGLDHILVNLFDVVFLSKACSVEWMNQDRFFSTRMYFQRYADHSYSFTDCFSFVIMKELDLANSLTKDDHFREAGFTPLLV